MLGLTEYGAKAYVALASLGPSGAAVVASAAPVPRTKVYTVLADLARRGWIESEGGRPRRYRALPPRECVARERARIDAALDAALPALEAQFQERATRFAGPLWILEGEEPIAERALEMVEGAKSDVLLVASWPMRMDEKALPRALRGALRRGARVRLVVPDRRAPHARALAVPGAQVREGFVPPRVLFVDGRAGMVAAPASAAAPVRAIWNPSPDLVTFMGGAMAGFWDGWADQPAASTRAAASRTP